jgi:hypothetical protein
VGVQEIQAMKWVVGQVEEETAPGYSKAGE